MLDNLNKYYGYARKIAGDLGEDLLHYLIAEKGLIEKTVKVHPNALDRYVYTSLLRTFTDKSGMFYRSYLKPLREPVEIDDTPAKGYDSIAMHTILLKLENEGYNLEVKVFKECYLLGRSELSFSKRSGTDYRVIRKMCKFVKDEIKKRYELD